MAGVPGRSRKPAIKRPKRHQWHFCNPAYDPNQPLPPKILPPHAPPAARQQDEWEAYRRLRPTHWQRSEQRYRQEFMRWLALRDVDWRNAFQQGLAAEHKAEDKRERRRREKLRQQAWQEYRAELFRQAEEEARQAASAGAGGGAGAPTSAR